MKKQVDTHVKAKDTTIKVKAEAKVKLNEAVQERAELADELQKVKNT